MKSSGMMWVEEMILLHHLYFQCAGADGGEMTGLSAGELRQLERYADMINSLVRAGQNSRCGDWSKSGV